ncbi:MAG TPA: carbohydrate-binding protein, partial [Tepidisphaeraceae bacterium]
MSTTGTAALHSAAALAAPTVQLPGTITCAQLGAGSTFRAGNNSMSGGSFAGWSTVGSIANYSVNSNGGTLADTLRYSTGTSGDAVQVQVDGQNVGSPVSLPSTGGWYNWRRVNLPQISLASGGHTVSLLVTGGDPSVNIQKWAFTTVSTTPTPTPPPPVVPPPAVPPPPVPPPPVPLPPAVGTVTTFELLDGATQQDLGPITEGEVITEARGQTFAIRTNTSGAIGSVLYNLDSGTYTHTENAVPYDLFGTAADGSSIPGTLGAGSHTLSATPYSSANDQGTTGSVYTIDFSVVQQTPPPTPPPPVVPPPPPPPPAVPPPPPPTPTGSVTGLELFDG